MIGGSATVNDVTAAIPGASLVHLAAHGTVRADNPLFSSVGLSDGPLTVYDLERLRRGADTVVLAACEVGRDVVLAGDELLGLSAAFLARETRQVIASVVPIPDAATARLMVSLHTRLAQGAPVAAALAHAQESIDQDDPAAYAAAAGFICIGAGFEALAPHSGLRSTI
jgi:CHAT domain-containing protein